MCWHVPEGLAQALLARVLRAQMKPDQWGGACSLWGSLDPGCL